ncbi:MAG: DMT family transporter [Muribaculaceae bacterium]|nr:DMT family transporter [Muribaculaceae bacterium]MDE6331259.1 DMT family transporter [Muribaculaceae bacterium]
MKLKGYILAAIAAATYGTNPAFAVPLYADGMNPNTVLVFRYLLGLPILACMLLLRGHSLKISRRELMPTAVLGVLMGISSLTLFEAYNYMNSGIASTLLFVYPVMVAVLMTFLFHERFRATTALCLVVMGAGLILLLRAPAGIEISGMGVTLVMLSSLTYSIYLVMTNVSRTIQAMPTLKLLFWQLAFGSMVFLFMFAIGTPFTPVPCASDWINLVALAVLPTVVSLGCTTVAIHCIGSTPTAIFGALEPVTAVALSILTLNQSITLRELWGGLLIVIATTMVVVSDRIDPILLRVRKMFPRISR